MENPVQLITYIDRLAGSISNLEKILDTQLSELFSGIHLLPFFDPIDGADAGFDPIDHTQVDSRLGNWANIKDLSKNYALMADMIINHVSSDSVAFKNVKELGKASEYWPLFLKKSDVFDAHASAEELSKILRLHPNAPFLPIQLDNGETHNFWSTFSDKQLDINVESQEGQGYLDNILDTFAQANIQFIRLDAVGFALKRRGTSCFMLPETFDFIGQMEAKAKQRNMQVLVEIHSHYQTQIEIAKRVPWVYDFALPPLVLHTLFSADSSALKNWLKISPKNCITVLDTHDGIGIIDAAGSEGKPGLLNDVEVEALINQIHINTQGQSLKASGDAADNLDISQLNTTYYDALGRSSNSYLLARAIQLFIPGIPQIYYAGLLAAENDMELLAQTKNGRAINRPYYSNEEVDNAIQQPVVQSLFELIRIRRQARAFQGDFSIVPTEKEHLHLKWQHKASFIEILIDLTVLQAQIIQIEDGQRSEFYINKYFRKVA